MEVTLTVEDAEGGHGYVSAVGVDYPDAYDKAGRSSPKDAKPSLSGPALNKRKAPTIREGKWGLRD